MQLSATRLGGVFCRSFALAVFVVPSIGTAQITEIIDSTGDGAGNILTFALAVAVDGAGNAYVTGLQSDNAFKITPGGGITEIIDASGDGAGNSFGGASGVVADGAGNVYVTGCVSDNAFKIVDPCGAKTITEIIDATGDGSGNPLDCPFGIAMDGSGNVYVSGLFSNNVFKITPGGMITEIIDATGDGAGNMLDSPRGVAVDAAGNVYVTGSRSSTLSGGTAFKITPGGVITQIIDEAGDGAGNPMGQGIDIAVDGSGNVFVSDGCDYHLFKITPGGVITEILGMFVPFVSIGGLAVDGDGSVYAADTGGGGNGRAFKITPAGVVTELIDETGDGAGNPLFAAGEVAVDPSGNLFVTGEVSCNAFKIEAAECFLVVGSSPSAGSFSGSGHTWSTQLSGITASYAVSLDDIPSFALPVSTPNRKLRKFPVVPVGEFHVQMLLWNPGVFPTNPEQWSKSLHVTMWSNGTATARRSGSKNGLIIGMETYQSGGQSYVRFPFSIIGF